MSSEFDFEGGGSSKSGGCCGLGRTGLIIIIIIVVVGVLALGLGLGLGLKDSSDSDNKPSDSGCKTFYEEKLTAFIQSTHGKKWLDKDVTSPDTPDCPAGFSKPPLLLISLDGFRAEYMERGITPNMEKLRNLGIKTAYMRPSFPTKTFPNHYSIVTGLYPESHGIIDNTMYDVDINDVFTLSGTSSRDPRWWHGEPIWLTAQKAGLKAGTMFWPGSEVKIGGQYPDICFKYDKSVDFEDRVSRVLSWLDMSESKRPDVITLYFHQPDSAGHSQGPYGDWVTGNVTLVDGLVGELLDGLIDRGLDTCVNVIVVSDHGMTPINCGQQVDISGPLADEKLTIFDGVMARVTSQYYFDKGDVIHNPDGLPAADIKARLECRDYNTSRDYYSKVYLKGELPVRNHYAASPRIEDVILTMADEWLVKNGKASGGGCTGGDHGYDNMYTNMQALFMAFGNSFNQAQEVEAFENIEVYNLMADVLGVTPASNNGTSGRLHHLLRHPPSTPPPPPGGDYKNPDFPGETERNQRRAASDCNCTTQDVEVADGQLDLTDVEQESSLASHLPTGQPVIMTDVTMTSLIQQGYVNAYSTDHKMAAWSAFTLNKQSGSVAGSVDASCTRVDVRLPTSETTSCHDYNNDYNNDDDNIAASYLLPPGFLADGESDAHISTNMVPMYTGFTQGIWSHVLSLLAEYRSLYGELTVLLGPVFDDNHDGLADHVTGLTRFVPGSPVPLPTHYFVVLTKCDGGTSVSDCTSDKLSTMSLLVPHAPDPGNCWDGEEERPLEYLRTHVARVRDVELITGVTFYPHVTPASRQMALRTRLEVGLWPRTSWLDDQTCDKITTQCPTGISSPPLLVISLDGVRPDYLELGLTPTLEKLGRCGVTTDYMLPIYPSLTFPNHYSLATGLYSESHGIVDNGMFDQHMDLSFSLGSNNKDDPRWWGGEPIWNTVQRHSKTSGVMFWPGSDVQIGGKYPTHYFRYDGNFPYSRRVDMVLRWLTGDGGERPAELVMLYMEKIDKAGHSSGPGSREVRSALQAVDGYLKTLMDGLKRHDMDKCVNIIVTSDHGMSDLSCEKTVLLEPYTGEEWLRNMYVYTGSVGRASNQYKYGYKPVSPPDRVPVADFIQAVSCKDDALKLYDRTTLPKRYHYAYNDRIDNITMITWDAWQVDRTYPWCGMLGQHGWDAATYKNMRAIFQGYGPGFKSELKTEPFEMIELYNLFTTLLGVSGAPNNGTSGWFNDILTSPSTLPDPDPGQSYVTPDYPTTDDDYDTRTNSTGCSCIPPKDVDMKTVDSRLNLTILDQADLLDVHLPYGTLTTNQTDQQLLYQEDYIMAYSGQRGAPAWVAYRLREKAADLQSVHCLRADVRLDLDNQPNCEDYQTSDYVANHLYPPGLSTSQDGVYDAHIITNTLPMIPGFATGVWRHLVSRLESMAGSMDGDLYVVSGPVYDYNTDGRQDDTVPDDRMLVGSRNISIPSHFFTTILNCSAASSSCSDAQTFIVEHRSNVTNCQSYDDYLFDHRARVRDVELLTGLEFFTSKPTVESIRTRLRLPQTLGLNGQTLL